MEALKERLSAAGIKLTTFKRAYSPNHCEFYSIVVPTNDLIDTWTRLRNEVTKIGWYPIVIDSDDELERIGDVWGEWEFKEPNFEMTLDLRFQNLAAQALDGVSIDKVQHTVMSRTFTDQSSVIQAIDELNDAIPFELKEQIKQTLDSLIELPKSNLDRVMGALLGTIRLRIEKATYEGKRHLLKLIECPNGPPTCINEIIEIGEHMDPLNWLSARESFDEEYYSCETGQWPNRPPVVNAKLQMSQYSRTALVLCVPAKQSWHVPAHLIFGDWNDCPVPQAHMAMLKYWNKHYGAELIAIKHDTIELLVSRPVHTRDDAMRLAQQQFIYNADIVHQGSDTLAGLAAMLIDAPIWSFWWD